MQTRSGRAISRMPRADVGMRTCGAVSAAYALRRRKLAAAGIRSSRASPLSS
jgi:hypothetical protein